MKKRAAKKLPPSKNPKIPLKKSAGEKALPKKPILERLIPKKNLKKSPTRISTGIPNLDPLIEGGFNVNSTNLLVGGSGSGKSIFAVQFLMEGLRKGESCLYITFEEKKKEFYSNMLKFGWNLEAEEKKGKFVFLEYTPEKVKTMLEEGGGIIESIVLKNKIKRIVIDSITSFELLFEEELKKREAALSLFTMLGRWNCVSLLTHEEDCALNEEAPSKTLGFEVDSIILLYFMREKKSRERLLEVLKMRGTKHSTELYPFSIEKNGIVIGKASSLKKLEINKNK